MTHEDPRCSLVGTLVMGRPAAFPPGRAEEETEVHRGPVTPTSRYDCSGLAPDEVVMTLGASAASGPGLLWSHVVPQQHLQ